MAQVAGVYPQPYAQASKPLNEEKYRVLGGRLDAERAARIVGIVYIALSVLSLNPITLILGVCVVQGTRKQKTGLYLPFLILHVSRY